MNDLLQESAQNLLRIVGALGSMGIVAFVPIYILTSLLLIPGPLLCLAAGALFGVPVGIAACSGASLFSAGAVFLAGRFWSRDWVFKKIALHEKVRALDDAATRHGWRMVALFRLTVILPFVLMNYALGLSKIRFRDYLVATWLGMMPGIALYVYVGSIAGEVVFDKTAPPHTPAEYALFGIGVLVTLGLSVYATGVVRGIVRKPAAD
jgi:uncharacterized membrane protein YdjX (TVP38/TMEM64 family)